MLAWLKRIAQKAELNCGRCMSTWRNKPATCAQHPVCANFTLHMFRHTYATTLLHDGVDVVSLQRLMGHKDINSTMKYLRMRVPADLLAKVNASSLATRYL
jgi:site-specific recombinase XerD